MNRVAITIYVDLPDGVVPDVEYGQPRAVDPVPQEPPHLEFAPIGSVPYDPDERAVANVQRDPAPLCQHGIPMKRYPAGVSKSTNKAFNASWRPSDTNCTTKPLWDKDVA